jgi:hypothetical protein
VSKDDSKYKSGSNIPANLELSSNILRSCLGKFPVRTFRVTTHQYKFINYHLETIVSLLSPLKGTSTEFPRNFGLISAAPCEYGSNKLVKEPKQQKPKFAPEFLCRELDYEEKGPKLGDDVKPIDST